MEFLTLWGTRDEWWFTRLGKAGVHLHEVLTELTGHGWDVDQVFPGVADDVTIITFKRPKPSD